MIVWNRENKKQAAAAAVMVIAGIITGNLQIPRFLKKNRQSRQRIGRKKQKNRSLKLRQRKREKTPMHMSRLLLF